MIIGSYSTFAEFHSYNHVCFGKSDNDIFDPASSSTLLADFAIKRLRETPKEVTTEGLKQVGNFALHALPPLVMHVGMDVSGSSEALADILQEAPGIVQHGVTAGVKCALPSTAMHTGISWLKGRYDSLGATFNDAGSNFAKHLIIATGGHAGLNESGLGEWVAGKLQRLPLVQTIGDWINPDNTIYTKGCAGGALPTPLTSDISLGARQLSSSTTNSVLGCTALVTGYDAFVAKPLNNIWQRMTGQFFKDNNKVGE